MKISIFSNFFLLFSLLILPLVVSISPTFRYADEIIFTGMALAVVFRILKKRDILFPTSIFLYLSYSIFLIYFNDLPLTHIFQIFITSKFLVIFLYFYTYPEKYKASFLKVLIKFITFVFYLSLIITIFQFIFPASVCGYSSDGRGIMGITAGGIFCSRILYSSFLIICMILILSLAANTQKSFRGLFYNKYFFLILCFTLLLLTFARKEIVISFLILFFLVKDRVTGNSKIILYFIYFILILGVASVFIVIFKEINNKTFIDTQIRYLMLLHALDIFNFYFPIGSGPGTYGSIMSISFTNIYEEFGVSKHIYLGYGDDTRGPIFDTFLIGLLAEYGLGVIFFFYFTIRIALSNASSLINFIDTRKVKILLVFHLLIVAFFVPIFLNWTGFLIFTTLGVLSQSDAASKKHKSTSRY